MHILVWLKSVSIIFVLKIRKSLTERINTHTHTHTLGTLSYNPNSLPSVINISTPLN